MIDELLSAADVSLRQLDAIAFGRGPGAFTGVRLGAGVAQGLAFAAGLPLLPISDLRALAAQALLLAVAAPRALICQDARMHEVYWGCYERVANAIRPLGAEALSAPGDVVLPPAWTGAPVAGAGSGFAAYALLLAPITGQLAAVFARFRARARGVALLGGDC